jgi:DnaJ-class molecular chaperone
MMNPKLAKLAREHFGVKLPVDSITLKKAYHKRCLQLHPDAGGDEASFKEMQAAYTQLTDSGCVADVFAHESEFRDALVTVCGTPLAELGLGLGPTTNGEDCPECEHRGYYEQTSRYGVPCDRCDGVGREPLFSKCRPCNGTGKFTQRRSRRVVDCRVCKGSGKFFRGRRHMFQTCQKCRGAGVVMKSSKTRLYVKCHECSGTGETEMWNPVLPKSILTGGMA